jgi:hypothetical protein
MRTAASADSNFSFAGFQFAELRVELVLQRPILGLAAVESLFVQRERVLHGAFGLTERERPGGQHLASIGSVGLLALVLEPLDA